MDADGDQKTKHPKREAKKDNAIQRHDFNVSSILQSFWFRCRSVFPYTTDGKFMESELRFVLYCGILLWFIHLLYQAIK